MLDRVSRMTGLQSSRYIYMIHPFTGHIMLFSLCIHSRGISIYQVYIHSQLFMLWIKSRGIYDVYLFLHSGDIHLFEE